MENHNIKSEIKTERIPLLLVYKESGQIKTDVSDDCNDYELWGFLKIFIRMMGKQLEDEIIPRTDNEEIL